MLFVEFESQLSGLFVWYAALDVRNTVHMDGALGEEHPRLPFIVAGSVPRVAAVLLARTDIDASSTEGFHRAEAAVRFLAPFGSVHFRDDTHERAGRAAVRLLRRQLNRCHVVLWHNCFGVCLVIKVTFAGRESNFCGQ